MAEAVYIVSSELAYNKLICSDAGPQYAATMHWKWIELQNLKKLSNDQIYIIDNRIAAAECQVLQQLIIANPSINFVAKIVDPYQENKDHYYYKWLATILLFENVRLLSVYEPKELTSTLAQRSVHPLIYIPYVYDERKELPLDALGKRSRKIIISGAINPVIYPFRTAIWKKTRRSVSRLCYHVLKHPGYAELSQREFGHHFVYDGFIAYLAHYRYMLLCGSRCQLEFLKYHECAYAGCLPVGEAPTCYPDEIKKLFGSIDPQHIFSSTLKINWQWSIQKHLARLEKYRHYLRETRSAEVLNQRFANHFKSSKT